MYKSSICKGTWSYQCFYISRLICILTVLDIRPLLCAYYKIMCAQTKHLRQVMNCFGIYCIPDKMLVIAHSHTSVSHTLGALNSSPNVFSFSF